MKWWNVYIYLRNEWKCEARVPQTDATWWEREKNTTTHAIQYIILQYKDGEPEIIAQVNEFLKSQKHIEVVVFFASVRMHMPILNK